MLAPASQTSQASDHGWFAAGASAIGTSHLADDKPCQDAHGLRLLPGGALIAAVSDGAGSAAFSEIGSRIAIETVLATIAQHLDLATPRTDDAWSALLRDAFAAAAEALASTAAARDVPLKHLSATLLVAVLHPARNLLATVGDCVAVTHAAASGWQLPVKPARGEYANDTTFLTSPDWPQSLAIAFLPETPDRLALFSDGLMRLALNLTGPAPHIPFFDSLFAFLTSRPSLDATVDALRQFLDSDRVNARTDDDKTLVIAWRPSAIPS